ncbi:MAG: META domain-containing protein [Pseudomonas sp.]|uniref:META domain-containing protein n=1 Tax=Pseudomonas sp. TaxID=306 RepID=UPI00272024E6|nr:META domain-containing protein [Pseudomonas sp.]MDO9619929.1 META domain-containing protein [Pseudomonas sp.]MDP2444129.1 META domain-containing protein [Pseudomonas sp.]MDZ4336686.1 META domain-containing protein [Pseudomonas sp.]
MKRVLTISLLAAGLVGCATSAPQLETEHSYQVEWIGERPLIDRSHLTITLGDDGRAYGNAGCNHWFASYTLAGDTLSFSAAGSTRKMCAPALMEQEARFLDSLSKVQRWDFSPTEQLRLWPAQGKPLRLWPEGK